MVLWSRFAVPVGWRDILKRTAAIYHDDCFGWSAELAYYFGNMTADGGRRP
jgi:hypothetical protein